MVISLPFICHITCKQVALTVLFFNSEDNAFMLDIDVYEEALYIVLCLYRSDVIHIAGPEAGWFGCCC